MDDDDDDDDDDDWILYDGCGKWILGLEKKSHDANKTPGCRSLSWMLLF